jgi:putative DNA methylase
MPTKLIEVALPLDVINREAAREKSIRQGHPNTLHLWWSRKPLAACRAVLFAQLVDDPSAHPELYPTDALQERERHRLFDIISRLVLWESSNDEKILSEARAEIRRCYPNGPPPIVDPFCGGGSIPLEAQRLGLSAYASDLNPVAVLITKALIEFPAKFSDRAPVHKDSGSTLQGTNSWRGAQGLAEDVRHYGMWMRGEAKNRLEGIYPKAVFPDGREATVIAWLWARTVTCPNPACRSVMPLVNSFWLGKKKGREAWVHPIADPLAKRVRFEIGHGAAGPPVHSSKVGRGAKFTCLVCNQPTEESDIKSQGLAGRMGTQLMAVVAERDGRRFYLPPTKEHERCADVPPPNDSPETELADDPRAIWCVGYGLTHHSDLFTARQLTTQCLMSDLVTEARERVIVDSDGDVPYADAIATYLALAASRGADSNNSLVTWSSSRDQTTHLFTRQGIPMAWGFAEVNPFGGAAGDFKVSVDTAYRALASMSSTVVGKVSNDDASARDYSGMVIATDPPYYDNIGYADLADFFYVWLRRSLQSVFPELLATMLTPKAAELVATPYRWDGNKKRAEHHFESGFARVFQMVAKQCDPDTPITIFYAFKQSESDEEDGSGTTSIASTGWEKMLTGILRAGLTVTGTWPMRTERSARSNSLGTNALASSIVLVCRPRPIAAGITDRRGFVQALKAHLGKALRDLQSGGVAPVDLAQAAIGPGMAVFSSYAKVIEPSGESMRVRTALALINQVLDEVAADQEGEFDEETRWAIAWYAELGMDEGAYGRADDLSRAKNVSVDGLVRAGLVKSGGGKVRLLERNELDPTWDPTTDSRLTVWEITQHLIRRLLNDGEPSAAELLSKVGGLGDAARDLAYRLFQIADAKKWSKEAGPYNALAASWLEISRLAAMEPDGQGSFPGLRVDGPQ